MTVECFLRLLLDRLDDPTDREGTTDVQTGSKLTCTSKYLDFDLKGCCVGLPKAKVR